MKKSPITNRWGSVQARKVETEHFLIYRGGGGCAYNHHHQITSKDGRLFATWSNAPIHEDSPGQHMLLSSSDDMGETWSIDRPLVDRIRNQHGYGVVTAMGIHTHADKMMAYYGYYDYDERGIREHTTDGFRKLSTVRGDFPKFEPEFRMNLNPHTGIVVSDDGGETWPEERVGKIDRFVANLCPQRLASGRLIIPGNISFPYTDDPYGISGWKQVSIPGLPDDYYDSPEGFWNALRHRKDPYGLCEASFFQTDDGEIHMMLRTESQFVEGRPYEREDSAYALAVTHSADDGESWSEPEITDYTDCGSRHHFGRLPDGRYFGLNCPEPGSKRTPMVIATSEDGVVFDKHFILGDEPGVPPRYPGHHKGGRYGYPTYHIMDGTMFVIYSIGKEDIGVCRFSLQELG